MKKLFAIFTLIGMIFSFNTAFASSKILVAYFSRVGEEYSVGQVNKGNTAIVAEIIANKTGADLFEIKTVQSYPVNYEECTKVASREKAMNIRPELATTVENLQQYDTIFIGYPIWWGDAPMAVYTFLESYDFSGKTVIPFCTHGGSGLSSTDQTITLTCPDSKILQGFEIRGTVARNNPSQTESRITAWLNKINM